MLPGGTHRLLRHYSRCAARRQICPYLLFICQVYVLRTSIDKMKNNDSKLTKERSRSTPRVALLANTPVRAETLLLSLERTAAGIGLHVNVDKMEYIGFNQRGDISTVNDVSLKLVDNFTCLGSSVLSTKKDINTRLAKAWKAIDSLSVIWKSDLTINGNAVVFQAAVLSLLLHGCITLTLTKRMEKTLNGNYTRMLRAILNKSWRQHTTK